MCETAHISNARHRPHINVHFFTVHKNVQHLFQLLPHFLMPTAISLKHEHVSPVRKYLKTSRFDFIKIYLPLLQGGYHKRSWISLCVVKFVPNSAVLYPVEINEEIFFIELNSIIDSPRFSIGSGFFYVEAWSIELFCFQPIDHLGHTDLSDSYNNFGSSTEKKEKSPPTQSPPPENSGTKDATSGVHQANDAHTQNWQQNQFQFSRPG